MAKQAKQATWAALYAAAPKVARVVVRGTGAAAPGTTATTAKLVGTVTHMHAVPLATLPYVPAGTTRAYAGYNAQGVLALYTLAGPLPTDKGKRIPAVVTTAKLAPLAGLPSVGGGFAAAWVRKG